MVFLTLLLQTVAFISPAQGAVPTKLCRSTDGTGNTLQTDAAYNGYYQNSQLRITPVYSKRMYVDIRNNFNATYIGYKISNLTSGGSSTTFTNLVVDLSGFAANAAVQPATANDTTYTITSLSPGTSATAYFLMKATSSSDSDQRHDVSLSILGADGKTKTEQLACYTNIQAVQRSLSASANKVTSISTSTATPAMGGTLDVTVSGTPGTIGSGELPDNQIVALSPATNSSWPTKALRLEGVTLNINGFTGNQANCSATASDGPSVTSGPASNFTASTKVFSFYDRLVLRNAKNCFQSNKQTYTVVYTFRVVGIAATNPAIRPYASISSGTQIKYTGTLPATTYSVNLTATTYPISVVKTFVSSVKNGSNVEISYRITASTASGTSQTLDELRDDSGAGMTIKSGATFTDNTRTSSTAITPTNLGTSGDALYRFSGPFTITSSRSLILNYVLTVPVPATTTSYTNYGYGMVSGVAIGNTTVTTGVQASVDTSGGVTPTSISNKQPQTIYFTANATMGVSSQQTLTGYSDSGLALTYESLTPSTCVVSELNGVWTLTAVGEGTCQVKATQAGNSTYDPATAVTVTVTVLKGQVITPSNTAFTTAASPNTAKVRVYATSKYLVSLVTLDSSICTVNASPVVDNTDPTKTVYEYTITQVTTSAGTCILTASQPGDATWGPAPDVDVRIGIGAVQNLAFTSPAAGTSYDYPATSSISVVVSSYVGSAQTTKTFLPVALRSATPSVCTLNQVILSDGTLDNGYNATSGDTTLSFNLLGAGTCTVIASQDGLDNSGAQSSYAMATEVSRSFTIKAVGTVTQTLTFDSISTKTYGDAAFDSYVSSVNASTSADTTLLVSISSNTPSVCVVGSSSRSGTKSTARVYLLTGGTCTLAGDQAGDATYKAATQATKTFTVNKKNVSVSGLTIADHVYDGTTSATVSGTAGLTGIVPGDLPADVAVTGTPSAANFSSANVGSETLSVSGLSLTGTKVSSSYNLLSLSLSGAITQRPITVAFGATTIGSTDTTTCLDNLDVTVGTLVGTQSLTAATCSPTSNIDATTLTAGSSYTYTPTAVTISDGSTNRTSNYAITYVAGTLTISNLVVPVVAASDVTVYYGELTSTVLGNGVSAKDSRDNSNVSGTYSQKINGASVPSNLEAGDYLVEVTFTPSNSAAYAAKSTHRTVKVLKRQLTYTGASAADKVYDGTTTASVSGSTSLIAQPGADGLGVLAGDDVTLAGTLSGQFASADVGNSKTVTLSGLALAGTKSANYQLNQPDSVTAKITPRTATITIPVNGKTYDGTTSAEMDCASASVDNVIAADQGDMDISCGYSTATFSSADAGTRSVSYAGTPASLVDKSGKDKAKNYTFATAGYSAAISKATPTIAAADVTKVYGQISSSDLNSGVTSKRGSSDVAGTLRHVIGSTEVSSDLSVGTYTSTVEFTPTDTTNYNASSVSRQIQITKRHITFSGATATSKVYDGTTTATVGGSLSLVAQTGVAGQDNSLGGVLSADTNDVSLNGSLTGAFASADASDGVTVNLDTASLTGSKAGNYQLHMPSNPTANITKRAATITIPVSDKTYDGDTSATASCAGATVSNLITADQALISVSCGSTIATFGSASAGSHSISYSGTPASLANVGASTKASNYTWSTASNTATINKRAATITLPVAAKTYDGTTDATTDCASASASNLVAGDVADLEISCSSTTATFASANAGTHNITYGGTAAALSNKGSATKASNYTWSTASNTATINKRAATITLPVTSKTYDGTTSAVANCASATVSNLVTADVPDLEIDCGSAIANFSSPNAGSHSISYSGTPAFLKNVGSATKANNYTWSTASNTATINQRAVVITVPVTGKTYDGTTDATLDCASASVSNLVSGDENDLTIDCGYTSAQFASANAGTHAISYSGSAPSLQNKPTKSKASNYSSSAASFSATIGKATPTVTVDALSDAEEGQTKSANASSNKNHNPVVLSVTASPAGACTISGSTITAVAQGTCTVTATQSGNTNYNAASASRTFNINPASSSSPSPTPTPTSSPTPTTTTTSTPSPTQTSASPSPSSSTTSASPSPTSNRPSSTPRPSRSTSSPSPSQSSSSAPAPSSSSSSTPSPSPSESTRPDAPASALLDQLLNTARKIIKSSPSAAASSTAKVSNDASNASDPTANITKIDGTQDSLNAEVWTIDQVAKDKIPGYKSGSGLSIEAIGARTTGQFVVTPGGAGDAVAISAAIAESTARTATEFAKIDSVVRTTPPAEKDIYRVPIDQNHRELFKASGLETPITLSSLDTSKSTSWVKVEASTSTYLPGSRVYLAVTTQPIIFAEAVVDKYGKAELSGSLPVDLLGVGGHSIRVVGVRSLTGVYTGEDGSILLGKSAAAEIDKFDDGTQATLLASGAFAKGGKLTAVRVVPLDRFVAWWTVWLAGLISLLALLVRFLRRPVSRKRKHYTWVAALVGGLPAAIIGWVDIAYELWIGFAIALVVALICFPYGRNRSKGKRSKSAGASNQRLNLLKPAR